MDDNSAHLPSRDPTDTMSNAEATNGNELNNLQMLHEQSQELVMTILDCLSQPDASNRLPQRRKWIRELKRLAEESMFPKVMIAICGASGAGKSTLINSLLGVSLVPTSGYRACTATPIEIRYHEEAKYIAKVAFLSRHEWETELRSLLDDFRDEEGNTVDLNSCSEAAKAARDKVSAVYPDFKNIMNNRAQLNLLTVKDLINSDTTFTCHLGSEQTIEDTDADRFSDALCELVATPCDSAQNGAWPLIKKVQLFCNAQILATGAVLVDLPGVNDSNKARNRVAKDYMDQCENYWLVAPVDRILDSDTMKELLNDGLKLRLANDALLSKEAITVIATKSESVEADALIRLIKLQDDEEVVRLNQNITQLEEDLEQSDTDAEIADDGVSIVAGVKRKRNNKGDGAPDSQRRVKEKRLARCIREKNSYCAAKRTVKLKQEMKESCYGLLSAYNEDTKTAQPLALEPKDFELQVFCTSATDYDRQVKLKRKRSRSIYFANIEDTEIPALQAWTRELTVPARKDALSSNIRSTADKLKWIKSDLQQRMMMVNDVKTESETGDVETSGRVFLKLKEVFLAVNDDNNRAVKQRCRDMMYRDHKRAMNAAARESEKTILKKLGPINKWLAFNSLLKCGVYKRKPDINVNLNDSILHPYVKTILPKWSAISESVEFSAFYRTLAADTKQLIKEFGSGVKSNAEIAAKQKEVWDKAWPSVIEFMGEAKKLFQRKKRFIGRSTSDEVVQSKLQEGYDSASGKLHIHLGDLIGLTQVHQVP